MLVDSSNNDYNVFKCNFVLLCLPTRAVSSPPSWKYKISILVVMKSSRTVQCMLLARPRGGCGARGDHWQCSGDNWPRGRCGGDSGHRTPVASGLRTQCAHHSRPFHTTAVTSDRVRTGAWTFLCIYINGMRNCFHLKTCLLQNCDHTVILILCYTINQLNQNILTLMLPFIVNIDLSIVEQDIQEWKHFIRATTELIWCDMRQILKNL